MTESSLVTGLRRYSPVLPMTSCCFSFGDSEVIVATLWGRCSYMLRFPSPQERWFCPPHCYTQAVPPGLEGGVCGASCAHPAVSTALPVGTRAAPTPLLQTTRGRSSDTHPVLGTSQCPWCGGGQPDPWASLTTERGARWAVREGPGIVSARTWLATREVGAAESQGRESTGSGPAARVACAAPLRPRPGLDLGPVC